MNVLKKSTLALAIAGFASAASAATITPALNNTYSNDIQHWVLSNEGIEVGQYHRDEVQFDLKVVNAHESRSEFDIVMPETLDLQELNLGTSGALTLLEVAGDSKYYINGTNLNDSTIAIRVGTGSFSVEAYKLNALTNTLTLISGVGQSLLPGSSVGITLGNTTAGDLVRISGAADITVNTYTDAREFIETAEATFATTADQFELSLREGTSELVDRVDQSYFASEVFYNDDRVLTSTPGTETDASIYELYQDTNEGVVRLSNDLALVAKADVDSVDLSLYADYSQAFSGAHDDFVFAADADGAVLASTSTVAGFRLLNNGTEIPVDADTVAKTDLRLAFDNATAGVTDLQNTFEIAAKLNYSGSITSATASNVELAKTAFGEWILDQAIINVPYMPVGYKAKGIDAVFEIANRGWADAAIKVKGFDQYGNVFPATDLVDAGKIENNGVAAAQTIVKVSADDILATFGLEEGDQRKMNITFMIDANRADIDLVPYYNNNGGRTPIMNSQYKDGAERR
ncbi:hypothetical protein [Vibrio rotiferianus]|uniref:hypothetical protein n=1 Tax=Vibrio rotiferianus TaxID=190895 RepID=UPI00148E62A1|nr:hypothetical protein [Vibrio rotiferianus]NOH65210.1 hypothetical protein [Vibrio rotiferianus]